MLGFLIDNIFVRVSNDDNCVMCPMLPVSQDCAFLIAPSIFSNVYSISVHFKITLIRTDMDVNEYSGLSNITH